MTLKMEVAEPSETKRHVITYQKNNFNIHCLKNLEYYTLYRHHLVLANNRESYWRLMTRGQSRFNFWLFVRLYWYKNCRTSSWHRSYMWIYVHTYEISSLIF
jgi:hypothetical protein